MEYIFSLKKYILSKTILIKNKTQQKRPEKKVFGKQFFPLVVKEDLTDTIYLITPPDLNSK